MFLFLCNIVILHKKSISLEFDQKIYTNEKTNKKPKT